jgi:hypothetical protein
VWWVSEIKRINIDTDFCNGSIIQSEAKLFPAALQSYLRLSSMERAGGGFSGALKSAPCLETKIYKT